MTAPALDHISRRILQLLAADGRTSYQAIADEIGLSRPSAASSWRMRREM